MSNDTIAQQMNLEHWMRDLPVQLKDVPLIYLAIPGISFCFFIKTKGFVFNEILHLMRRRYILKKPVKQVLLRIY